MKRGCVRVAVILAALVTTSCEMVFTTSPLAFLQRDPARLSPEQQLTFGRDALASGDRDQMAEAFELLKESDDPDIQLLAGQLGIAASGLEAAVYGALPEIIAAADDQAALQAVLDETLEGFSEDDLQMMGEAAALVAAAEGSVTPSAEQYVFAAVALIAVAAEQHGGVGRLERVEEGDPGYADVEQAKAFLDSAYAELQADGQSTDFLEGIGEAIGWAS